MKRLTTKEFITKAKLIHGDKYDYSKVVYRTARLKVKIICPDHGEFCQVPDKHMHGHRCPVCFQLHRIILISSNAEDFINKANLIHKNLYNYSKIVYKNNYTKIIIGCKIHGDFLQSPDSHLQGRGCPHCKNSISEGLIREILIKNNIEFVSQFHIYEIPHNKRPFSFDFYIPSLKIAIECQGEQHYYPIEHFGGYEKFLKTCECDKIKYNYCLKQGINLIEIPYWKIDTAEHLLKNAINTYNNKAI